MFTKSSPIWGLLYIVAIGGVLWVNASNFDVTEHKALLEIFGILAIGEFSRKNLKD